MENLFNLECSSYELYELMIASYQHHKQLDAEASKLAFEDLDAAENMRKKSTAVYALHVKVHMAYDMLNERGQKRVPTPKSAPRPGKIDLDYN